MNKQKLLLFLKCSLKKKRDSYILKKKKEKKLQILWKKGDKNACPQIGLKEEKMNWTEEQTQAIHEKGNNILVAAAARKW